MATIALLAPAGCSLGGDGEPRPAEGEPAAIGAVVDRLERAVSGRDFATICDELLTRAARERAGGGECARQLRAAAGRIERPRIAVRSIEVEGMRALTRVRTRAAGQALLTDKLELVKQGERWRIEALR